MLALDAVNTLGVVVVGHQHNQDGSSGKVQRSVVCNHALVVVRTLKDLASNRKGEQVAREVGQEDHSQARAKMGQADNVGSDRGHQCEEASRKEAVKDREANQGAVRLGKHPQEATGSGGSERESSDTDGTEAVTGHTDQHTANSVGTRHDGEQLTTLDVGVQVDNIAGVRRHVGEGDDVREAVEGGGGEPEHETSVLEDGPVHDILLGSQRRARQLARGAHNKSSETRADKVENGVDAQGPVDADAVEERRDDKAKSKTTDTCARKADAHSKTTVLIIPEGRDSSGSQVEQ